MKYFIFAFLFTANLYAQEKEENSVGAKDLQSETAFTNAMRLFLADNYSSATEDFNTILKKYGDKAAVYFMLSKSLAAENKFIEAQVAAEKSVKIDDENYYYLQNLSNILIKNLDYKEANTVLRKMIKIKPRLAENYFILTDLLMIQEKEKDALRVFDDLEKEIGQSEEITQKRQFILLKQNKVKAAISEGNKFLKDDPEYIRQQVQILLSNNKTNEAIAALENTISENPSFFEAKILLSDLYAKTDEKIKGKRLLDEVVAQNNIPVAARIQIFANYLSTFKTTISKDQIESLLETNKRMIDLSPMEPKLYLFEGDLRIKNNEPKTARDAYLNAVKYDKSIYEAWLAITEIDSKLGLIDDLLKHSEKALEYFPNQGFFWYNNGFANKLKRNFDDAIFAFEEAKKLSNSNPELKNHIEANLGDLYIETKKFSKGEAAYDNVLALNPKHEQTLNNYSYYLATQKKNLSKALLMVEDLNKLYPGNAQYLDTKALVLYNSQKYTEANEIIDKALKASKKPSFRIFELKGDIMYKLKQTDEALSFWEKSLDVNPNNQALIKKIKDKAIIE